VNCLDVLDQVALLSKGFPAFGTNMLFDLPARKSTFGDRICPIIQYNPRVLKTMRITGSTKTNPAIGILNKKIKPYHERCERDGRDFPSLRMCRRNERTAKRPCRFGQSHETSPVGSRQMREGFSQQLETHSHLGNILGTNAHCHSLRHDRHAVVFMPHHHWHILTTYTPLCWQCL
jgi:hypothetical protein